MSNKWHFLSLIDNLKQRCHKERPGFQHSCLAVCQSHAARFAEFGRACVQRVLEGESRPPIVYYGMLKKDLHKPVVTAIESAVFSHWDSLPESPAKTRPREVSAFNGISGLKLMSCDSTGRPGFPDHIFGKFKAGSDHRKQLEKMKADFAEEFASTISQPVSASPGGRTVARVAGSPDFTVDGVEPLDVNRVVDLQKVSPPEAAQRPLGDFERVLALNGKKKGCFQTLAKYYLLCV